MLVKEFVYSVLDQLKNLSDDTIITEEHVIFLMKKYRAFLIKKEQEKNRGVQDAASEFETQQICLDLEKIPALDGEPCTGGYYLRTTKPIPKILEGYQPRAYPIDYYQGNHITFVSKDRMKYVGSNPYLQNIIYCSISPNLHLYLYSSNPQFLYLKKLRMVALFEDFEEANELSCDDTPVPCDILDMEVPMREHLVPTMLELIVKELSGAVYRPRDEHNSADDNLPKMVSNK